MEIASVTNVDGYTVNNSEVGDITVQIHKAYLKAVAGQSSEYNNWLTPVYVEL